MIEFKPTYLYIKIHNQTGLQYLGKTCQKDPIKYRGSGTYWNLHIRKYGYDVTTYVIGYYTKKDECQRIAFFYSWFYDVVKSDDWANLKEEDGIGSGGSGYTLSPEHIEKIREWTINENNRRLNNKTHNFLDKIAAKNNAEQRVKNGENPFLGGEVQREHNRKRVKDGSHHLLGGKIQKEVQDRRSKNGTHNFSKTNPNCPANIKVCCIYCHKEVNITTLSRCHGNRCEQNINREKRDQKIEPQKECCHCHRTMDVRSHTRYHGEKCKMNSNEIPSSIR